MRARRSGTIVNISSIGARACPAGSGYYAATKAAMEAMTSPLRKEVQSLGIAAFAVEPGAFRTDLGGRSLTQSAEAIADDAETAGRRRVRRTTARTGRSRVIRRVPRPPVPWPPTATASRSWLDDEATWRHPARAPAPGS
jgi:NAD(P)-dependent dehydrogenase (short-subunit alcohol dehydrogenase family)